MRIHVFKRLYIDDVLVILAWLVLLANTAVFQSQAADFWHFWDISTGAALLELSSFDRYYGAFARSSLTNILLSGLGIWCIKFAFLAFFRRLGQNVRHQRVLWWVAFGVTVACLGVYMGVPTWHCFASNTLQTARE